MNPLVFSKDVAPRDLCGIIMILEILFPLSFLTLNEVGPFKRFFTLNTKVSLLSEFFYDC